MCCLRYEDATYEELRKRLPKNKTRVGTAEGPGIVVDSKILVQLVLVRLDPAPGALPGEYGREIAVPVEELMDPDACPAPGEAKAPDPMRGMSQRSVREKLAAERNAKLAKQDRYREKAGGPAAPATTGDAAADGAPSSEEPGDGTGKKRKRRRKKKKRNGGPEEASGVPGAPRAGGARDASIEAGNVEVDNAEDGEDGDDRDDADGGPDDAGSEGADGSPRDSSGGSSGEASGEQGAPRKRRRRRRRRGGNRDGGGGGGGDAGGGPAPTA
jgi:hypothetical protein